MDVAPIGLCSAVLKPPVSILAVAILVFLETEVTIFGKGDAKVESYNARQS